MADPNFSAREFDVEIRPASVLFSSLMEMKTMAEKAALIVTQYNTIQIFTRIPNLGACAVLDIESDHIFAPSNSDGYSLFFNLNNWLQVLRNPIFREPASSLFIRKFPGSMDLYCIFGDNHQLIRLGEAEFAKQDTINLKPLPCLVRVTMRSGQFTELIHAFAIRHCTRVSAVQMQITTSTIRWVTPTGNYDHPAQRFSIEGLTHGAAFQFRLMWHFPLFLMLCSASLRSDGVELSVLLSTRGEKLYRFRFLCDNARYFFYYLEKEPLPPH